MRYKDEHGEWHELEFFQGDSAYDIAVRYGFEGTEEEFLESLKGEQGPQGEPYTLTEADRETIAKTVLDDIDIPTGGGGGEWELLSYTETTERVNAISVPFALSDKNTNYQIMVYVPPSTEDITNVGKCAFYINKTNVLQCIMSSNSSNRGYAIIDIVSCTNFSMCKSIFNGAGLEVCYTPKLSSCHAIPKGCEFKIAPATDNTKVFEIGTKIWIWAAKKGSEVQ